MALYSEYETKYGDWSAAPTTVALSVLTARSALLPPGLYRMAATASCFFRQGDSSVVATTSDHVLSPGDSVWITVTGASNGYIAGIVSASVGTLTISRPV